MPSNWDAHAVIRKEQIEAGKDLTFTDVFIPIYSNLIKEFSPNNVLEIGAGTGHMALQLHKLCSKYHAIEPSCGMYDVARAVLLNSAVVLSNTSSDNYQGQPEYDLILSHLCLQAVNSVEDFFASLKPFFGVSGKFLFSIPHPCFYNSYKKLFGGEYSYMKEMSKNIDLTISLDPERVMRDIPYFHRPLSRYFQAIHQTGFVLHRFGEVFPEANIQERYGMPWETPRYCWFICSIQQ